MHFARDALIIYTSRLYLSIDKAIVFSLNQRQNELLGLHLRLLISRRREPRRDNRAAIPYAQLTAGQNATYLVNLITNRRPAMRGAADDTRDTPRGPRPSPSDSRYNITSGKAEGRLSAVGIISRSQLNDGFRTDFGPSRGAPRRRALRQLRRPGSRSATSDKHHDVNSGRRGRKTYVSEPSPPIVRAVSGLGRGTPSLRMTKAGVLRRRVASPYPASGRRKSLPSP